MDAPAHPHLDATLVGRRVTVAPLERPDADALAAAAALRAPPTVLPSYPTAPRRPGPT